MAVDFDSISVGDVVYYLRPVIDNHFVVVEKREQAYSNVLVCFRGTMCQYRRQQRARRERNALLVGMYDFTPSVIVTSLADVVSRY